MPYAHTKVSVLYTDSIRVTLVFEPTVQLLAAYAHTAADPDGWYLAVHDQLTNCRDTFHKMPAK